MADLDAGDVRAVSEAVNAFGFDLLGEVTDGDENAITSPYAVAAGPPGANAGTDGTGSRKATEGVTMLSTRPWASLLVALALASAAACGGNGEGGAESPADEPDAAETNDAGGRGY
ncbi:MAG: hypothetical protein GEU81_16670 [Nitriliruptorales bacterium]|nr:hypothetical protein [Nitriliruptorales bacterium]